MTTAERGALSRVVPRLVFCAAVVLQLFLVHRAYSDPHKRFGFQPYNESDTIRARIVRVTRDGKRIRVTKPWFGYRWDELVRSRGLQRIHRMGHASSGARSVIAFLDEALDWVADNTPRDTETLHYEARVTYYHNTRGPHVLRLRSKQRALAPAGQAGP